MSDDLLEDLRTAATFAEPREHRQLYSRALAEIERCHERLEIDHCYVMTAHRQELRTRRELPYAERLTFPDAVTCRNATIAAMKQDAKE